MLREESIRSLRRGVEKRSEKNTVYFSADPLFYSHKLRRLMGDHLSYSQPIMIGRYQLLRVRRVNHRPNKLMLISKSVAGSGTDSLVTEKLEIVVEAEPSHESSDR